MAKTEINRFNHRNLHHYQTLKAKYPRTVFFFEAWLDEFHLIESDARLAVTLGLSKGAKFAFVTKTAFVPLATDQLETFIETMLHAGHRIAVVRQHGKETYIERIQSPERKAIR